MVVLISGASKGIGFFLLKKFLNDGINVNGTYNASIPQAKYKKYFTKVNISDKDQINEWISKSVADNDRIVLINCASINYNSIARKAEIIKWKQVIDINLVGTFSVINSILPYMHSNNFGRIINFSSVLGQKGIPGTSAYAASKSALWGMTKCIAIENANKGITINNLNLGYFDIGMTITDVPKDLLAKIKKEIPSQQIGNPENIYNAIKFIIDSDYINGTSIDINGGLF